MATGQGQQLTESSLLSLFCSCSLSVQVSTRFLSACPALYWYAAHLSQRQESSGKRQSKSSGVLRWLQLWSGLFIVVGTALFSTFLPWT